MKLKRFLLLFPGTELLCVLPCSLELLERNCIQGNGHNITGTQLTGRRNQVTKRGTRMEYEGSTVMVYCSLEKLGANIVTDT